MLNMARGVLEGDCLTVVCRDDFTMHQLDCDAVAAVLRDVTSNEVGHPIRVQFRVGQLPPHRPNVPRRPSPHPRLRGRKRLYRRALRRKRRRGKLRRTSPTS